MGVNVYDVINSRIMELLESGTVPWKKTWRGNTGSNRPKNIISKKEYRGVNIFLLTSMQYSSPYWMTYRQCDSLGGNVKRGMKSSMVIFWKWIDKKGACNEDADTVTVMGKIPMLKYHSVFNLEQTEGIEPPPSIETINTFTPIERAEQIIAAMPLRPDIHHGGNAASYSPMLDYVKLPVPEAFESSEEYFCCCYHELIHSTGHASRVGRKGILEPSYFGSHEYSKEELVAEMGAAFLCGHAGIEQRTIVNSAAYIRGWLKALKNDKTLLIQAASAAQRASDYILNRKGGEDEVAEDTEV
jgi:antirestriction protein ArdC